MITLQRISQSDMGTFGVLMRDKMPLCVTLERPWKNNKARESCIPAGLYQVHPHSGAKFKNVWEIVVPGRTAILFHAGNTLQDTTGCVLVGRSFNSHTIRDSVNALEYLRVSMPDKFVLRVLDPSKPILTKKLSWWERLFKGEK